MLAAFDGGQGHPADAAPLQLVNSNSQLAAATATVHDAGGCDTGALLRTATTPCVWDLQLSYDLKLASDDTLTYLGKRCDIK